MEVRTGTGGGTDKLLGLTAGDADGPHFSFAVQLLLYDHDGKNELDDNNNNIIVIPSVLAHYQQRHTNGKDRVRLQSTVPQRY